MPRLTVLRVQMSVMILLATLANAAGAQENLTDGLRALEQLKRQLSKGEFETSEQFAERARRVRQRIELLLGGTYVATAPLSFDPYNADTELLPVALRLSGFAQPLTLKVGPADAQELRRGATKARGIGSFWIEYDGSVYLVGRLSISANGKTYRSEPSGSVLQHASAAPVLPRRCSVIACDRAFVSRSGGFVATQGPNGGDVVSTSSQQSIRRLGSCDWLGFSFDDRYQACSWRRSVYRDTVHVSLFDIVNTVRLPPRSWPVSRRNRVLAVALSPIENVVAMERPSGNGVVLHTIPDWTINQDLTLNDLGDIASILYSRDGRLLAVEGTRSSSIVEVQTGTVVHGLPVTNLRTFLPDGRRVIAGATIFDIRTGAQTVVLDDPRRGRPLDVCCVHPDGAFAFGTYRGSSPSMLVWDLATGAIVREFPVVEPIDFLLDGTLVVGRRGQLLRWRFIDRRPAP